MVIKGERAQVGVEILVMRNDGTWIWIGSGMGGVLGVLPEWAK